MIQTTVIEAIAEQLFLAEKEKKSVEKFVDRYPELDEALAYTVQDRLIELKCEAEESAVSWA